MRGLCAVKERGKQRVGHRNGQREGEERAKRGRRIQQRFQ